MKEKVTFIIVTIVALAIIGISIYLILNHKEKEKEIMNENIIDELQKKK